MFRGERAACPQPRSGEAAPKRRFWLKMRRRRRIRRDLRAAGAARITGTMDVTGKSEQAFRTIGEVAESLDLPPHVLRFWETRFKELEPVKRAGGRRYYRPRDVELVMALRHLLYGQGYTIKGVQRILKEQGARAVVESLRAGRFQPGFAAAPDEEARQEDAQDGALDRIRRRLASRGAAGFAAARARAGVRAGGRGARSARRSSRCAATYAASHRRGALARSLGSRRGRRAPLAARAGRSRRVPPPAVAHNEMKTRRRRCHRARGPL